MDGRHSSSSFANRHALGRCLCATSYRVTQCLWVKKSCAQGLKRERVAVFVDNDANSADDVLRAVQKTNKAQVAYAILAFRDAARSA